MRRSQFIRQLLSKQQIIKMADNNEIILYQPDETIKLVGILENEIKLKIYSRSGDFGRLYFFVYGKITKITVFVSCMQQNWRFLLRIGNSYIAQYIFCI